MIKFSALSISKIVEATSGNLLVNKLGDGLASAYVTELGEPNEVGSDSVSFIISESFLKEVPSTKASVLVVQNSFAQKIAEQLPETVKVCISSSDAYLGLAHLSRVIVDANPDFDWKLASENSPPIHPTAKIDSSAKLGPGVVISQNATIGARTVLLANVVIGPNAVIGSDCVLFPGVVVYQGCTIGNRVRIHSNVVIGSDGFGYARGKQGSVKIWHLGKVVIGDDVEIGAGTMIDKGTLKDTVVERGAKIDNLVRIGHNGHVKAHAILCAQVGMAGNVTIGQGAILAGKAGIADKLEIGDGAIVGPMSGLSKDVKPGEVVMGRQPAKPRREWWKTIALIDRLPDLFDRVKSLENSSKSKT